MQSGFFGCFIVDIRMQHKFEVENPTTKTYLGCVVNLISELQHLIPPTSPDALCVHFLFVLITIPGGYQQGCHLRR